MNRDEQTWCKTTRIEQIEMTLKTTIIWQQQNKGGGMMVYDEKEQNKMTGKKRCAV